MTTEQQVSAELAAGKIEFVWELCGKTSDGSIRTYKGKLPDGTLYLTRGPLDEISTTYVPDETYIVDDTDYSQVPGGRRSRRWAPPPAEPPKG